MFLLSQAGMIPAEGENSMNANHGIRLVKCPHFAEVFGTSNCHEVHLDDLSGEE